MSLCIVLAVLLTGFGCESRAGRLVLQDGQHGYSGTQDTWLNEGQPRDNYGGAPYLRIRYDREDGGFAEDCVLVRFALPAVSYSSLSNAVLELFYVAAGSMQSDNAVGIKPYRVAPAKNWYENNRNGQSGEGASWRYFGQVEAVSNEWTSQSGGWYDKLDDGNGTNLIKRPGGTVPGAVEPDNWVPFTVTGSVTQWLAGATNNGLILFTCSFQGGGYEAYGDFAARETNNPARRPRLRLHYAGAQVVWTGAYGNVWDTAATNWLVGGWPGCYDDGDHVLFNDSSIQTNVFLSGSRAPQSVTVSNVLRQYTFSGAALSGTGGLVKNGPGTCRFAASNQFTGATVVREGTLVVLTNGALGSTAGPTMVESNGTLCLYGVCDYAAPEPLVLTGTLSAAAGYSRWCGPVLFAPGARLQADAATLEIAGDLSGTGGVRVCGSGEVRFTGGGTSTWSGVLSVETGTVRLDRPGGAVLSGDLAIGDAGAATVIVARANQWSETCRIEAKTNSLLSFTATGATYTLRRLYLRAGTIDTGPTTVTLADTVTAFAATSPSRLRGVYTLVGTSVVFRAAYATDATLIIEGSLLGGGVEKADFGTLLLAGASAPTATWRVSQGTLTVAHPDGLGTAAVWVNTHSTLNLATNHSWTNRLILQGALYAERGAEATWAGEISLGPGTYIMGARTGACLVLDTTLDAPSARLRVTGGGTVVFRRPSNHSRGTEVTGTLVRVCNSVGSALGTGSVELQGDSTLTGTGLLYAAVVAQAGSRLKPGDPVEGLTTGLCVGTLTVSNNVGLQAHSELSIAQTASGHSRLELLNGGVLSIDANAVLSVNSLLQGTRPLVIVSGARDLKGAFAGLPPGSALPWPNQDWYIHYQPNGIYLGRNARPLCYFRAVATNGQVLLAWRTPLELDVVGFDLYREEGGQWQKVNEAPLPAEYPQGGVYYFTDPTAPPDTWARYQLVQLLGNGQSNVLTVCDRNLTALEFTSFAEPSEEQTVLRWRSREDEEYWLEWKCRMDGPIENAWGPITATPEENAYTVPLLGTQGFFRVRWVP